jgi:opacity protein-like surface antigen
MSARTLSPTTLLTAAVCAAAAAAMPMLSAAAGPTSGQGGTITFVGRILGPSFDVSSAPIAPVTEGGVPAVTRVSNGIKVTFSAPNGGVPGAEVSFIANGAQQSTIGPGTRNDVVTNFVDPKGRAFAWQPDGYYHLRPEGGVLSLTVPRGTAQAAPKPVTMVVSYD